MAVKVAGLCEEVLSASVNMYSFQGSMSANVYHNFNNITGPPSTITSPMTLDLSRPAGRIIGRVAVTNTICGVTNSFSIFALMRPLDGDGDGVADADDNCPAVQNADQAAFDGDGTGDVCDSDLDGDGVADTVVTCPTVASPNQTDTDGDGLGDICDPDTDGRAISIATAWAMPAIPTTTMTESRTGPMGARARASARPSK